jgi:mono/diheme cytochrome c family protein
MKKLAVIVCLALFIASCTGSASDNASTTPGISTTTTKTDEPATANPSYDPNRGEGKFKNVDVSPKLDVAMAANGEKIFGVKCSSCHKLTDEKLVGPGWHGVTSRHSAPWIMNFITNTDAMIDKDPKAQAALEICLVRMPNQNLSDDDARALYEYMRKNDGVK